MSPVATRPKPEFDRVLDALGEPHRRALVQRLQQGPCPVADLARGLPVTRPAVSQHLKVLLDAGLVEFERSGTRNVYRLKTEGVEHLRAWVDDLWTTALASFAAAAVAQDSAARRQEEPEGKT